MAAETTAEVITIQLRRMRPFAIALLLLAACGGGEDDPAIEVPEIEGEATEAPEEPEAGDGGSLTELAGAWAKTSAKVSYDQRSGTTPPQTMILYWRPPDSWRMDIVSAGAETIIISTDAGGFVCTGAGGAAQCIQTPSNVSAQAPIPFTGLFSSPEGILDDIEARPGGADLERSTARIAGVEAECFSAGGSAGDASGEAQWCFSDDGILLRYAVGGTSTAGVGTFSMEATEVDRRVRASDFEPPYPVTEAPRN